MQFESSSTKTLSGRDKLNYSENIIKKIESERFRIYQIY